MGRLRLSESEENVLLEELEELRKVESENQRLEATSGDADKIEPRSDGQLLYIAMWYAVEALEEENRQKVKKLEAERNVGGKHLHTDKQYMSKNA